MFLIREIFSEKLVEQKVYEIVNSLTLLVQCRCYRLILPAFGAALSFV